MGSYDHRGKTSRPFACFWESLTSKEEGRERARYILKPISEYHSRAKKVLEIGCGIGEVLINLPERYSISGLDIERDYIEVCRLSALREPGFFVGWGAYLTGKSRQRNYASLRTLLRALFPYFGNVHPTYTLQGHASYYEDYDATEYDCFVS